jgi:pyrroloquinoline quinone (PQQ) biosynthesis protein C
MIGNALGTEIAKYAVEMRRSNPLFTKAQDGSLTADRIAHYLANIHHLIRHTPIYLARARDRARALGDARLAAHYQHKRGEEVGHDVWAERDIERVSVQAIKPVIREVMPAIDSLIDYLAATIDEDPALYLSYILFTEQLIVILGPEWLMLLEERCGIPRSSMTVIDNHAELDKEHVEEALEEIDALVGDPRKLPQMRSALRASIAFFDQFCVEITSEEGRHDTDASRDVAAHVSAA